MVLEIGDIDRTYPESEDREIAKPKQDLNIDNIRKTVVVNVPETGETPKKKVSYND